MNNDFFKKNDFKALTTLSIYSLANSINEKAEEEKNNIIFITSFGFVIARSLIGTKNIEKPKDNEDNIRFLFQSALKTRDEFMKESDNDNLLKENTSFILEDVQIRSYDGTVTNLPTMILFSDVIQGLTIGDIL
ncbi:hypothetical protein ACH434_22915 [Lysinibacillus fusiformis]|uniref:hypothetical protein n=1 Tax=Lysinibacillus fusiformis TaxID=28031 RepID=UPI0037A17AB5